MAALAVLIVIALRDRASLIRCALISSRAQRVVAALGDVVLAGAVDRGEDGDQAERQQRRG